MLSSGNEQRDIFYNDQEGLRFLHMVSEMAADYDLGLFANAPNVLSKKSVDPQKVLKKATGIMNCNLDFIRGLLEPVRHGKRAFLPTKRQCAYSS